ncbi:unnamed protein product [Paramecium pentaurelia]|uniref:Uncharacterized protein n=1 Tax=Paramecium pentaurelia TaxID=43138 RepID=A0A8S1U7B8_9CILI|nr:unnamed protein product [Paramecium pentaurelia]
MYNNCNSQLNQLEYLNFEFVFPLQQLQFMCCYNSTNMSMKILQCKILYNIANYQGGGLFLDMNKKKLQIKQSKIMNNIAQEGSGIYILKNGNINQDNLITSFLNFNKAINFADNLVDSPTHLILMINSSEMESEELSINNISIRRLNASLNI